MRTRVEKLRSPPLPAAGPKLRVATLGSGFLSMNSVSDLRFCSTEGGTRTVNGTSAASSAVPGISSTTMPSSAAMTRSPNAWLLSAGQTSSSAFAADENSSMPASAA